MNHIKEMREQKAMSRTQLSKIAGVPVRTIDDWENERRKPRDVYQIKKISDALGCNIEQLIDFDE